MELKDHWKRSKIGLEISKKTMREDTILNFIMVSDHGLT